MNPPPRRSVAAAWALAAVGAVAIVKGTRLGPVVLVVSDRHGLGVHTGDALALLPCAAAAAYSLRHRLAARRNRRHTL